MWTVTSALQLSTLWPQLGPSLKQATACVPAEGGDIALQYLTQCCD